MAVNLTQAMTDFPLTPLLKERKYCADRYSIRLDYHGFMCADGKRRTFQVWWSCGRLADDHAGQWQMAHKHCADLVEKGELLAYWVYEVYDGS